jgi:hypothetical protein
MKNSRVKKEVASLEQRNKTLQEEMISASVQIQENDAMIIDMRNEILEYRGVLNDIAAAVTSTFPELSKSINETLNKYPQAKADEHKELHNGSAS